MFLGNFYILYISNHFMGWYFYSIIAAIILAVNFLLIKKVGLSGLPVNVLILYMWGIASIILLGYHLFSKQSLAISKPLIMIVIFAALTALAGNYFLNKAVYESPNPGYATAVASLQILIVVISSFFIFGSDLTIQKFIGAMLVLVGVFLLGT